MAQLGPTLGVVKPGSGMSMWERSLQPSGMLSRHGRLVKALEHHTMQPKAWKTGKGTRASYHAAKRIARHVVHNAR